MTSVARGMFNPLQMREAIVGFLREDIPNFDVGGEVVGSAVCKAKFFVKSPLVIAGFPFVDEVLDALGCKVVWAVNEGTFVNGSSTNRVVVGSVEGPANRLLQAERTALELLTRCSACATYARRCVMTSKSKNTNWSGKVAATRKTTPGPFRAVEKYGAIVGGADPHRYNLSSMVMLKDNHIDIAGGIAAALRRTRELCGFSIKIEVECRSVADAIEAATGGADVVMLDNFTPDAARKAVPEIKKKFPHVIIEMSGGINDQTVADYAVDGVDIVSIGLITHGPPPVDISMKITPASKL
ncbi:quinolinate phosphoribosyl transferase, putative [Bodo saltans]|uniref:Nicotinate-nucleotide pyrophosphorylase [carboxylating] n=1 Tax=Bodo saltans TaxID=75058 RepID=A0A0S4KL91_BODSA|nr:quinolinate phosphoribosyl transferase, putative [Bodo saltans]|eukprot:CUI15128.1 quinolinate phosphoribosyl transferase, putative [Bodo saltans]